MTPKARITVVVNDEAQIPKLRAEHGWSVWVEYGGHHVLLDTGQGPALAPNSAVLGLPWDRLEAVALSHGHYDHTGGLLEALTAAPRPGLYAHPDAWQPKYACPVPGPARAIGTPPSVADQARRTAGRITDTLKPVEVVPGLWLTGPIPRRTDFEDAGGPFFKDSGCRQPDGLPDDQALFFESRQGLVVLLGCAHAGVINTLNYIRGLRPGRTFKAVLGGMHLLHAGRKRLRRTLDEMERLGVERLLPAHCTGAAARDAMSKRFGDRCEAALAGLSWTFELDGPK